MAERMIQKAVAAQLINMLYNIVDRIYIGHIPGDGAMALTGVGVCMPLIMIVSAFAALVGFGGSPRASIYMGKGDNETAEKILGNCFTAELIISAILTAALFLWNRDFLLAFGASANTVEYGVKYMNIYAVGTVFVQLTLSMNAFITAQGFAKTGMLSVLIGAVSNIILDPILIFAFGMGVEGAALATIISQALSCIWVLAFLFGKKTRLRIRTGNMRLRRNVILPCLALGLSTFIMQASESIISICFNSSLLKYGGDIAVGAMTILTSVMQFAMLPLQGLGQGAPLKKRLGYCLEALPPTHRFSSAGAHAQPHFLPIHSVPDWCILSVWTASPPGIDALRLRPFLPHKNPVRPDFHPPAFSRVLQKNPPACILFPTVFHKKNRLNTIYDSF